MKRILTLAIVLLLILPTFSVLLPEARGDANLNKTMSELMQPIMIDTEPEQDWTHGFELDLSREIEATGSSRFDNEPSRLEEYTGKSSAPSMIYEELGSNVSEVLASINETVYEPSESPCVSASSVNSTELSGNEEDTSIATYPESKVISDRSSSFPSTVFKESSATTVNLETSKATFPLTTDPSDAQLASTSDDIVYLDSTWYGFALEIDNDALAPYLYNFKTSIDGAYYPICVGQDLDPWFNKRYYRGFAQWDTNSIPDGSDILSVKLSVYLSTSINPFIGNYVDYYYVDMDFYQMSRKPSSYGRGNPNDNKGRDLFNDAKDGTLYTWYTYIDQGGGWYDIDLGSSAAQDLENQLGSNWFATGFHEYTEGEDGTGEDRGVSLLGGGYSYLTVKYTPPPSKGKLYVEVTNNDDDNHAVDIYVDGGYWSSIIVSAGGTATSADKEVDPGNHKVEIKWYDADTDHTYSKSLTKYVGTNDRIKFSYSLDKHLKGKLYVKLVSNDDDDQWVDIYVDGSYWDSLKCYAGGTKSSSDKEVIGDKNHKVEIWWHDDDTNQDYKKSDTKYVGSGSRVRYDFNIDKHLTSVSIHVKNVDGSSEGSASVLRYDSGWNYIDKDLTDSSGWAYWSSVPDGTYNFEVYNYYGEFWGDFSLSVGNSGPKTYYFTRFMPHAYEITTSKDSISYGESITVTVKAKNPSALSRTVRVRIIIDRSKSSPWDFESGTSQKSIDSGNSWSFDFSWIPDDGGTYYVWTIVETYLTGPAKWVLTDHWEWYPDFIVKMPDLIVLAVWTDPSSPTSGQPFTLKATIKNNGNDDAIGTFYVRARIEGTSMNWWLASREINGLSVGSTADVTWEGIEHNVISLSLTTGSYSVRVIADLSDDITESVEDNNEKTKAVTVNEAKWTVIAHLDGEKAEVPDKKLAAIWQDLLDLETLTANHLLGELKGSSLDVTVIALIDRDGSFNSYVYYVTNDAYITIKEGFEANMGDPSNLKYLFELAKNTFQAERYWLISFSHGSGLEIGYDLDPKGDYLSLIELKSAFSETDFHVDIYTVLACLMGNVHFAYQLRDYVDVLIASPVYCTSFFGDSGPWNELLAELKTNPSKTTRELAIFMTEKLGNSFWYLPFVSSLWVSMDLTKITQFSIKLTLLSNELMIKDALYKSIINQIEANIERFKDFRMVDLYLLLDALDQNIDDPEIRQYVLETRQALDALIIARGSESGAYPNFNGPFLEFDEFWRDYGDLWTDADWSKFLARHFHHGEIRVSVHYPDGSMVSPVGYQLFDKDWNKVLKEGSSDEAEFFIEEVHWIFDTVHVVIYQQGFFVGSAENVNVIKGEVTSVTVWTNSKVTLDVLTRHDGAPIDDIRVKIYNHGSDLLFDKTTDSTGSAFFQVWPTTKAGEYYKVLVESPYRPETATQYLFTNWDDGDSTNPRTMTITSDTTPTAYYKVRHYLFVQSPYGKTLGSGWYDEGTYAYAGLEEGLVSGGLGVLFVFTHWSQDATGTNFAGSNAIYMDGPKTATANWKTMYYLTVNTNPPGLGGTTGEGWYDEGDTAIVTCESQISPSAGTRYIFTYWSGDASGTSTSSAVYTDGPKTATANYKTQYQLDIQVSPLSGGSTNPSTGSYWHDSSLSVTVSETAATGYAFDYWDLDGSNVGTDPSITVVMNSQHALTAVFKLISHVTTCEIVNGANAIIDRFAGGPHPSTVTLSVKVKDMVIGDYLSGTGLVEFYVNGVFIGSDDDTDGNQLYEFTWDPPSSWLTLGAQTWEARFLGTPAYAPSSTSSTITLHGQLYNTLLSPSPTEIPGPGIYIVEIAVQVTSDSPLEDNIRGCIVTARLTFNGIVLYEIPLTDPDNDGIYTATDMLEVTSTTPPGSVKLDITSKKPNYHDGKLPPIIILTILTFHLVEISISPAAATVQSNTSLPYTVSIHNIGNVRDTYDLILTGLDASWYTFAPNPVTFDPDQTTTITLTVSPPATLTPLDFKDYSFTVKATCQVDPTAFDTADAVISVVAPILIITVDSPVNILITAPNGPRVGYNPETGTTINKIPGATYSGPGSEPQVVQIPNPLEGNYLIDIFGTGTGTYTITMESLASDGSTIDTATWTGTTEPGQHDTQTVEVEPDGTVVIKTYSLTVEASPSDASGGTFLVTYTLNEVTYADEEHITPWTTEVDVGSIVTISSPQEIIDKIPDDGTRYSYLVGAGIVTMDSNKIITLEYITQYYLAVSTNFGTVSPNSGWFDAGTTLTIEATAPSVIEGEQYVWLGWTGTGDIAYSGTSNPAIDAVTMNSPVSETASWRHEFRLTITTNFGTTDPPEGEHWYEAGSVIEISAIPPSAISGEQYVWNGWSGTGSGSYSGIDNPSSVIMNGPIIEIASWTHQFYLEIEVVNEVGADISSVVSILGQAWYDAGTEIDLTAPQDEEFAIGSRYDFRSWTGDISDITNKISVIMTAPRAVTAHYMTQHYLTVNNGGHGTASGQGWYDSGVSATFSISPTIVYEGVGTRFVFTQWSCDSTSRSPSDTILMDGPKTVTANWKIQYQVTFEQTGSGATTYVTYIADTDPIEAVPFNIWVEAGSTLTFSYDEIVNDGQPTRYVLVSVDQTSPLTVNEPVTITATYKTQHYLKLGHLPIDPILDGHQTGQGYYDADSIATVTADSYVDIVVGSSQYMFDHWSGDASGTSTATTIVMIAPKTATANYKIQYYITVTSAHDNPTPSAWVDAGSDFTASVTSPTEIVPNDHQWVCTGFSFDGGAYQTGTYCTFTDVQAAHTIEFAWKEQFWIQVSSSHDLPTTSQWIDQGGSLTVSVTSPADDDGMGTRYRCTGYTLDSNPPVTDGSTSYTFENIQDAHTITFNWIAQYYLTMSTNFGEVSPSSGWYDVGTEVIVLATPPDVIPNERYVWNGWSGTGIGSYSGPDNPATITMNSPIIEAASWTHQYYISVSSAHDAPSSSDWLDQGNDFTASVTSPTEVVEGDHQWVCTGFSVDGGPAQLGTSYTFSNVQAPHTITFNWKKQFWIQVNSDHDSPTSSAWVDKGSDFTASVTSPADIEPEHHQWVCSGFRVDEGPLQPDTSYTFINVQAPHTIVFSWWEQFWVTLTYTGDTTGQYSDPTSVSAILTVTETGQPLEGKKITFTIGAQSATATTNEDGIAATSITITQPTSAPGVVVEFLGDRVYLPRFIREEFTINKEDALVDYTGDTVVPTSARTINLRATVYDSDDGSWGDLTKIQVIFRIYTFTNLATPVVTTDPIPVSLTDMPGVGVAAESIDNLNENGYIIIVSIKENDYYRGPTSDPTALTVYEPTGEFVTGGGWIWENETTRSKGNFGFNAKYTKSGKPKGHSIYVYREGEWNYIVKSNAWIGLAINSEENHAYFEAKCVVQKYNPETEELVWDEGNYKFRVDVWDNDGDGGVDVYQIRVLDKNGVPFHEAGFDPLGELQGGNIVIHDKRR